MITSAVSAYYYLRVLFYFFMKDYDEATSENLSQAVSIASAFVIAICALSQLWFGVIPSGILNLTDGFFQSAAVATMP